MDNIYNEYVGRFSLAFLLITINWIDGFWPLCICPTWLLVFIRLTQHCCEWKEIEVYLRFVDIILDCECVNVCLMSV